MNLDTGKETLVVRGPRIALIGLMLVASEVALSTTSQKFDRTPGIAILDDHVQQVPAAAQVDVDCGTITASSERAFRYVCYHNPDVNGVFFQVVTGAEALSSVGATYPTDAAVTAAIPNADWTWTEVGRGIFARDSGSVVSLKENRTTGRAYEVPPDRKDVASGQGSSKPLTDAVYRYWETIRHTIDAANISNADLLTDLPLPLYNGRILRWREVVETAITTAAKGTTPHLEINATAVTGTDGVAMAGAQAKGVVLPLGAPTAARDFVPGDTITIVGASTTTYVEGRVRFEIELGRLVEPA